MSKINDGGPAFPLDISSDSHEAYYGMSLRDYFAAKAMVGLLSSRGDDICESTTPEGIEGERMEYAATMAEAAYRFADALLAALEVQP